MRLLFLSLLPVLVLNSCASYEVAPSPAYSGIVTGGAREASPERLLRRAGSMEMKCRSVEESAARCVSLVTSRQGRMEQSTLTEDDYRATIRVPSASLEPLMDSLSELGRVSNRSISSDDVTEQFRDLEAEIKNTRALRDRLRDLLEKSTTVKDTLAIEKELVRVQTKLDQLEGRLKRLRSQVAYSSLSVEIEKSLAFWSR